MLSDISDLEKEERIKTLLYDNISKNQNMMISSREHLRIDDSILSKFFDKTWDKFTHITESPSFEYTTKDNTLKYISTATIKVNNIKSLISILCNEEYEFKSFIIYNLYRDNDSIYFRFATVDDIPAVIRENRNKKIDNILNGKSDI